MPLTRRARRTTLFSRGGRGLFPSITARSTASHSTTTATTPTTPDILEDVLSGPPQRVDRANLVRQRQAYLLAIVVPGTPPRAHALLHPMPERMLQRVGRTANVVTLSTDLLNEGDGNIRFLDEARDPSDALIGEPYASDAAVVDFVQEMILFQKRMRDNHAREPRIFQSLGNVLWHHARRGAGEGGPFDKVSDLPSLSDVSSPDLMRGSVAHAFPPLSSSSSSSWNTARLAATMCMQELKINFKAVREKIRLTAKHTQNEAVVAQTEKELRDLNRYMISKVKKFRTKRAAQRFNPFNDVELVSPKTFPPDRNGWAIYRISYLEFNPNNDLLTDPKRNLRFSAAITHSGTIAMDPLSPEKLIHMANCLCKHVKEDGDLFKNYLSKTLNGIGRTLKVADVKRYTFRRLFWQILSSLLFVREYCKLRNRMELYHQTATTAPPSA